MIRLFIAFGVNYDKIATLFWKRYTFAWSDLISFDFLAEGMRNNRLFADDDYAHELYPFALRNTLHSSTHYAYHDVCAWRTFRAYITNRCWCELLWSPGIMIPICVKFESMIMLLIISVMSRMKRINVILWIGQLFNLYKLRGFRRWLIQFLAWRV
jgi:hypothetical protein